MCVRRVSSQVCVLRGRVVRYMCVSRVSSQVDVHGDFFNQEWLNQVLAIDNQPRNRAIIDANNIQGKIMPD